MEPDDHPAPHATGPRALVPRPARPGEFTTDPASPALAIERALGRAVVIRRTNPGRSPDDLLTEAAILSWLEHPGIIPVHALCEDEEGPFLVLRRIHGTPWSRDIGRQERTAAATIVARVAEIIAYAHSRGVVHRDLRPGTVLLGGFGEVLVMGWDQAVAIDPDTPCPAAADAPPVAGSATSWPPEIAAGDGPRTGTAADIYGIGALLYHALTGGPPHPGADEEEILAAALANHITPVPDADDDPLLQVALAMMATLPEARLGTALGCAEAIREALRQEVSRDLARAAREDLALGGHEGFTRARMRFAEALRQWPGNARARRGLEQTRTAHARHALAGDDLSLAASLLDPEAPEHADLLAEITARRTERAAQMSATARAQERARIDTARAHAADDFLDSLMDSLDPARSGHAGSLLDALTASINLIDRALPDDPLARGRRHACAARAYLALRRLDDCVLAAGRAAAAFAAAGLPEDHPDREALWLVEADLRLHHDDRSLIEESTRRLTTTIARLGPAHPMTAMVRLRHVGALYLDGRLDEAAAECEDARVVFDRTLGTRHPQAIQLRLETAGLALLQGRIVEAEEWLRGALAVCDDTLAPHHQLRIYALTNLCHLLLDQGRDAEAEPVARMLAETRSAAYGPDCAAALAAGNLVAVALIGRGRPAEAVPLAEAAAAAKDTLPPVEPHIVIADARLALGDQPGAEAALARAQTALHDAGGDHWLRALITGLRGRIAAAEGDLPAAAHLAAAALAFARRRLGADDGRCRRLRVQWVVAMAAWTGSEADAWVSALKPDMRAELDRGRRELERFPGLRHRATPWTARTAEG